jgi:predicted transcriptional regulator
MENGKVIRFTAYDVAKFDSVEELCVFDQVYTQSRNEQWVHSINSRQMICKHVNIAEITCKVLLRTLLKKGALIKIKKAVYKTNLEFVTKQH